MICTTNNFYVLNPVKRQANNGKQFWTFYVSLGKYTKGKNIGKFKGNLNFVFFDATIELKHKMKLLNCEFDVFTETKEGREFFKAVLIKFNKPEEIKTELIDVNDALPPIEENPVATAQFGDKIIELDTQIDPDLQKAIDNYGK